MKRKVNVKGYYRKRHGKSDHGGMVSPHSRKGNYITHLRGKGDKVSYIPTAFVHVPGGSLRTVSLEPVNTNLEKELSRYPPEVQKRMLGVKGHYRKEGHAATSKGARLDARRQQNQLAKLMADVQYGDEKQQTKALNQLASKYPGAIEAPREDWKRSGYFRKAKCPSCGRRFDEERGELVQWGPEVITVCPQCADSVRERARAPDHFL